MSEGKSMVDEMAEKMIEKLNITGHSREELSGELYSWHRRCDKFLFEPWQGRCPKSRWG